MQLWINSTVSVLFTGLDRFFAILCNASSIRDVIAFPKSMDGKDLMSKSPASVSQAELDSYNIHVKLPDQKSWTWFLQCSSDVTQSEKLELDFYNVLVKLFD